MNGIAAVFSKHLIGAIHALDDELTVGHVSCQIVRDETEGIPLPDARLIIETVQFTLTFAFAPFSHKILGIRKIERFCSHYKRFAIDAIATHPLRVSGLDLVGIQIVSKP